MSQICSMNFNRVQLIERNNVHRNDSNVDGNFEILFKGLTTALRIALLKDS